MIKYYELYFENYSGETISVDVEINLKDVADYLCCSVVDVTYTDIIDYCIHHFRKYRPFDLFYCIIPIDFPYSPAFDIPDFLDVCLSRKAWY